MVEYLSQDEIDDLLEIDYHWAGKPKLPPKLKNFNKEFIKLLNYSSSKEDEYVIRKASEEMQIEKTRLEHLKEQIREAEINIEKINKLYKKELELMEEYPEYYI